MSDGKCARCPNPLFRPTESAQHVARYGVDLQLASHAGTVSRLGGLSLVNSRNVSFRFCEDCSRVLLDVLQEQGWVAFPQVPAEGKPPLPDFAPTPVVPRCPSCGHGLAWSPWLNADAGLWVCFGCSGEFEVLDDNRVVRR